MWLQLRRLFKNKFPEGKARKFTVNFAFCAHVDVIKIKNKKSLMFSFERTQIT